MPLGGAIAPSAGNLTDLAAAQALSGSPAATVSNKLVKTATAIADSTATLVATVKIPNARCSAVLRILIRSMITAASHVGDSVRVVEYLAAVTRQAGGAAVLVLSSAQGAAIATVSAGNTLTTALAAGSVSGANSATQTIPLNITNVGSVAGISETSISVEVFNDTAGLVSVS